MLIQKMMALSENLSAIPFIVRLAPAFEQLPDYAPIWKGDAEQGKRIASGRFVFAGCDISFFDRIQWHTNDASENWLSALHSFSWIRDLRAYDMTADGSRLLQSHINDWQIAADTLPKLAFASDIAGERICQFVAYAPYILQGASPTFSRRFRQSIVRQTRQLRGQLRKEEGMADLPAIKGLFFAAALLPRGASLRKEAIRHLKIVLSKHGNILTRQAEIRNIFMPVCATLSICMRWRYGSRIQKIVRYRT